MFVRLFIIFIYCKTNGQEGSNILHEKTATYTHRFNHFQVQVGYLVAFLMFLFPAASFDAESMANQQKQTRLHLFFIHYDS